MNSNYNDCDFFNLKYISLPDNLCLIISYLKEEELVFGVFLLFIIYAIYHKIKGTEQKAPSISFPKIRTINTSSSFQRFVIVMFFTNLLVFILFY